LLFDRKLSILDEFSAATSQKTYHMN